MDKRRVFLRLTIVATICFLTTNCTSSAPLLDTPVPTNTIPTSDSTDISVTQAIPTPVPINTNLPNDTSGPTANSSISNCAELLTVSPWNLVGYANGDAQSDFVGIENLLAGKDILQVTIDVHGASFGEGDRKDESAIIIDQPDGQWTVASVVTHGLENGKDGEQVILIPLSDFVGINSDGSLRSVLDLNKDYGPLHARFWNKEDFTVDIKSIMACNS